MNMVNINASDIGALDLTGRLKALMQTGGGLNADSLIEYTKPTRVEPIVLLDQRALQLPYTSDIMQSVCSIFSGYYLQAVALSMNVGKIDVLKVLGRANPGRDPAGHFVGEVGSMLSMESYEYALPRPGMTVSNENSAGFGKADLNKLVQEAHNLSVGKLLEIHVEDNGHKATFPVSVRMVVSGIAPSSLVHTLAIGSKDRTDKSTKERFHAWRAGQLEFIRDLVLCQDLIDQRRKDLIKDDSNFYANTLKRRNKNFISAMISGSPSIATASSIYVLTQDTAKELEDTIGGKLKDFKTREKVFKETYGMLMVVIDTEWEQVTIYHRSLDTATELSVRDVKGSNRGSGPDVLEILKAYQMGSSPSL